MQPSNVGIVGAKLLYPDNRIQYAGTIRNLGRPRVVRSPVPFQSGRLGTGRIAGPTLAVTGACMYITREALDRVGLFDEAYPMAYEDVDHCLRAWQAGFEVLYAPDARLHHLESITRGTDVGERERTSQRCSGVAGSVFDDRAFCTKLASSGSSTSPRTRARWGSPRHLEHLNGLSERGHEAELWTLGSA